MSYLRVSFDDLLLPAFIVKRFFFIFLSDNQDTDVSSTRDSVHWKAAFWVAMTLLILSWVAGGVLLKLYLSCPCRHGQSIVQASNGSFGLVTAHNNEGHCVENETSIAGNNRHDLDGIGEGVIPRRVGPDEL